MKRLLWKSPKNKALSEFWMARSPRERQMLVVASLTIIVASGWKLVLEPLIDARTELAKGLPALHANVVHAKELAVVLSRSSNTSVDPSSLTEAIVVESLRRHGLQAEEINPGPARWKIKLKPAPASTIAAWSSYAVGSLGLRVQSARLEADKSPGMVHATMLLDTDTQ
jgi:type II secretory pathway component PulM